MAAAPEAGGTLAIESREGQFLGWACYSPESQIRARVWSWQEDQPLDAALIDAHIASAVRRRHRLLPSLNALRLVHGEADGLPGCVVDRYGDLLVVQLKTRTISA